MIDERRGFYRSRDSWNVRTILSCVAEMTALIKGEEIGVRWMQLKHQTHTICHREFQKILFIWVLISFLSSFEKSLRFMPF